MARSKRRRKKTNPEMRKAAAFGAKHISPEERRMLEPLDKPPFGPPVGGGQCRRCEQWYHLSMFWRKASGPRGGHRIQKCQFCLDGSDTS